MFPKSTFSIVLKMHMNLEHNNPHFLYLTLFHILFNYTTGSHLRNQEGKEHGLNTDSKIMMKITSL